MRQFWPAEATLENFEQVLIRSDMPRYVMNSIFYVTVLVALSLIVNSTFGYALAKFEFRGKNLILTVVLSLLVLPLESILLSLFFIVNRLGWADSYLALIIPFMVKCFDVYLFRQFFLDIPDDLIEAAEIDGAGPFKTFVQVVVSDFKARVRNCIHSGLRCVLVRFYVASSGDYGTPPSGRCSWEFRHSLRSRRCTTGRLWQPLPLSPCP